jgi:hypothetical protein
MKFDGIVLLEKDIIRGKTAYFAVQIGERRQERHLGAVGIGVDTVTKVLPA